MTWILALGAGWRIGGFDLEVVFALATYLSFNSPLSLFKPDIYAETLQTCYLDSYTFLSLLLASPHKCTIVIILAALTKTAVLASPSAASFTRRNFGNSHELISVGRGVLSVVILVLRQWCFA